MHIDASVADRIPTRKILGSCGGTLIDPFRKREVYYESLLERDHLARLIASFAVKEIREQQLVCFRRNGRICRHHIDYVATHHDGRRVAYFVKNKQHAETTNLRQLIKEIVAGCDTWIADEFAIITENHLDQATVANSLKVIGCGRDFDAEAIADVRDLLRVSCSTVTPREVERRLALGDRASRALIALLQSGDVRFKFGSALIDMDTPFDNRLSSR